MTFFNKVLISQKIMNILSIDNLDLILKVHPEGLVRPNRIYQMRTPTFYQKQKDFFVQKDNPCDKIIFSVK